MMLYISQKPRAVSKANAVCFKCFWVQINAVSIINLTLSHPRSAFNCQHN